MLVLVRMRVWQAPGRYRFLSWRARHLSAMSSPGMAWPPLGCHPVEDSRFVAGMPVFAGCCDADEFRDATGLRVFCL